MINSATLRIFDIGPHQLQLYVPDINTVRQNYQQAKREDTAIPFPYWAQIWPAALGLCHFLVRHTSYIQNKRVLELAAGLGLPSLLSSYYAREVNASDYIPEAVELMQQTSAHNKALNMQCTLLNWNHLPAALTADTLLLSDINYDPAVFETVYNVLQRFLNNGATIIVSTPQRLIAKPFIDRLLPFCVKQEDVFIETAGQQTEITVLVLKLLRAVYLIDATEK